MTDYYFPTHVVKENESLADVAELYDVPRELIAEASINKFKDPQKRQPEPGQTLVIPARYTIQPGDSAESVARRFGVEPDFIVTANQDKDFQNLRPGQILFIPPPPEGKRDWRPLIAVVSVLVLAVICLAALLGTEAPWPRDFEIFAPPDNITVLVGSPVQIQSAHPASEACPIISGSLARLLDSGCRFLFGDPGTDISRVELWVSESGADADKLRSDVPENGLVLQEWVAQRTGTHIIRVRSFDANNVQAKELTRTIEVTTSSVITLAFEAEAEEADEAAEIEPPTPTPSPPSPLATEIATTRVVAEAAAVTPEPARIVIVATATPEPPPTPTPYFPPPPPAPGVPPGPTQKQLPALIPPVCDAAEYLGPFTEDGDIPEQIFIHQDDQIPAKVTAGSLVHRAWRLQNIGTCTWGTNYELAFYGGRNMGSGGVAFESFFPTDPEIRNRIVDRNRLIAPEGKPNQIAVLELLLNTPVIPGIHQSYWRMRNPQGVYFGPIVGVTLEVVRDCDQPGAPRIFGAPFIRVFRILGVDNRLVTPGVGETVTINFEAGERLILDWDVIDSTNHTIVIRDPTGDIQTISTDDPSDRASFTVTEVGEYVATLFADNGSCEVKKQLTINVVPPEDQQFVLSVTCASDAAVRSSDLSFRFSDDVDQGACRVKWTHFDEADRFILIEQRLTSTLSERCPIFDSIFGSKIHCFLEEKFTQDQVREVEVGNQPEAEVTVQNLLQCPVPTASEGAGKTGFRLIMRAEKDGRAAEPEFSNKIDLQCAPSSAKLSDEIFDPDD